MKKAAVLVEDLEQHLRRIGKLDPGASDEYLDGIMDMLDAIHGLVAPPYRIKTYEIEVDECGEA